ncbi:MAG TPA: hypothetical protein VK679_14180, partial [Gemmatimonadaceae bacterium]|nr:hypothetical protein [Gemmatimonadaceae bacterium]
MQRLAIRLLVLSSLCWWGFGLAFSSLWWLTNSHQLAWIAFCYAWEVPVIGWTGAVVLPMLRWRRIGLALAVDSPRAARDLARFPRYVAICAIATSTIGYTAGAAQLMVFAHLPYLEE